MNYIIGCGGVGSAIVPSFCLLRSPTDVTLIDGDTIERKNLNRQMFDPGQIGMNKAQALAGRYGCHFVPEWYARGKVRHHRTDWLICLVDNHRTRLEVLEVCDDYGCQAIFAANEMHSAEAYHYRRSWNGTNRDPRIYYPELTTDQSGDPRAAAIGCTGGPMRPSIEASKTPFGHMQLIVHSPDDAPCMVQRSANLQDWTDWQMVYPIDRLGAVLDESSIFSPLQFYRLKVQ